MQRLVVGLDDDEQADAIARDLARVGATTVDTDAIRRLGALTADFPSPDDLDGLIAEIAGLPGVAYVEPVELRGPVVDGQVPEG